MAFGPLNSRTYKFMLTLALIVGISWVAHKAVRSNTQSPRKIKAKIAQINRDLRVLEAAAVDYRLWFAFFPWPDWVKDLPEEDFMRWMNFAPSSYSGNTKSGYLEYEKESDLRLFVDDFKLFTEPWTWKRDPKPWDDPNPPKPRPIFPEAKGHIRDPFDPKGGVYVYTRDPQSLGFLVISRGPDGDLDIDEKRFNVKTRNLGFERPLISYRYDPTNGSLSSGDIYLLYDSVQIWDPNGRQRIIKVGTRESVEH